MRIVTAFLILVFCSGAALAVQNPQAQHPASEIDSLFAALAKVDSEEEARSIEDRILTAFLKSDSPTVDLLMTHAAAALHGGKADVAKTLIAAVTRIAPDYAEGWHQRAEMQAEAGDDQGAMYCLEKTVTLNPRHFEALTELASKVEEYGDKTAALKLYRRALALDPFLEQAGQRVRALEHEVEGQSL
ncbi:MAG: hypothetical protein JO056_03775 [Alphaproteobacteria bacterium]|nr:hypothetical protein [Alphaproteobacteria bacterium]